MKMKKLLVVLFLLLLLPAVVYASTYSGYHWRSANNLIVFDTTYSPKWVEATQNAVDGWNQSPNVEITLRRVSQCPKHYKVCIKEVNTEAPPYYAFAVIWPKGDIIHLAQVVLNDWAVDFSKDQAIFDRTMCHEIGHVLGLSPSADPDSCMGGSVDHPSAADYALLETIYGGH